MQSEGVAYGVDIESPYAGMCAAHDSIGDFVVDHREALSWQIARVVKMPFKLYDAVRWHHKVKQPGMLPVEGLEILVPVSNTQHQPPLWANVELQPAYFIESDGIAYLHRVDPNHPNSVANMELLHAVKNTRCLASELSRVSAVGNLPAYNCLATRVPLVDKPVNGFLAALVYLSQCHPDASVRSAVNRSIDNFALAHGVAA